jgi:hypothetical protein
LRRRRAKTDGGVSLHALPWAKTWCDVEHTWIRRYNW